MRSKTPWPAPPRLRDLRGSYRAGFLASRERDALQDGGRAPACPSSRSNGSGVHGDGQSCRLVPPLQQCLVRGRFALEGTLNLGSSRACSTPLMWPSASACSVALVGFAKAAGSSERV